MLSARKFPVWAAALGVVTLGALLSIVAPGPTAHAAISNSVLILDSSVTGGSSSLEAQEVTAQGFTPVVVDDATWEGMTTAQFASYRAIVIGDPTCGVGTGYLAAALSNPATWGAAINGNVLIIGTDPVFHSGGTLSSGPGQLIAHGIDFALAQSGKTGAYIDLSCAYADDPPNTPATLLDGIRPGGFSVDGGTSSICYNDAHIVATHPALAGLTDADLSNWSCSVHESFDNWPSDFTVLAMARNFGSTYTASDGSVGEPYILASGSGLHSFPLSLSPVSQNVAAGSSASVTAQLLDSATSAPVPGKQISFRVQNGPDAGITGTCSSSCITDVNGQATWSFTGSKATAGATDTVQAWIDTNGDGTPSPGEPQTTATVTWTGGSTTSTCTPVYYIGARGSGEHGPGERGKKGKIWPTVKDKNDQKDPYGFGAEVYNVYTQLQTALGGTNIQADSVNYPADAVPQQLLDQAAWTTYFQDLSAGVRQAHKDLVKQAALCPEQEIVMAGYSQGAMVMHRVLHLLGGTAAGRQILSRVATTVLIGDGDQVPSDNEVMDGSAWHNAKGIGQYDTAESGSPTGKFSSSLASRVIRVCNRGDIVCDPATAVAEDLLKARALDPFLNQYLKGLQIHLSYPGSKPLVQAAGQATKDAQALNYYGGKLIIKGKVGLPISASAVVIGGKLPLLISPTIDGGEPSWLALGGSGNNTVTLGGTPPAAGSWTFDIAVQDAAGSHVLIPVSLTVK